MVNPEEKANPLTEPHAVIPGMGLTVEKGSVPWERPPLSTDPDEIWDEYVEKFQKPGAMEKLLTMIDKGMPIEMLVNTMTTMGTMSGLHTVHLGIALRPVLHEYISRLADSAGIEYNDSMDDLIKKLKDGTQKKSDVASIAHKVKALMKQTPADPGMPEGETEEPMEAEEPMEPMAEPGTDDAGGGLFGSGTMELEQ